MIARRDGPNTKLLILRCWNAVVYGEAALILVVFWGPFNGATKPEYMPQHLHVWRFSSTAGCHS